MKYLKYFKTEIERSDYKSSSNFILPNVNYVVESGSVDFNPYVPQIVPPAAGDIVYYKDGSLKTIGYTEWKSELGTPVGVITIPAGFAPDGKARMVALSGQVSNAWGDYGTDTRLTNYNRVPTTDNVDSTSTGSNPYGYLPSDNFTGATSYVDSVAKYSKTSNLIPSPYAGDAPNPDYYKTISGYNNALSDFSGKANTELLVGLETDYPAANACWTYSDGISNTKWYLPAMGELGYMMPRFNEIQAGLAAVSAVQLDSSNYYWSSSEYSPGRAYYVYTSNGPVDHRNKYDSLYARPWAVVE